MQHTAYAAGIPPCPPVGIAELPPNRLRHMTAAGDELLEIHRILAKTGDSVVGELLRNTDTFYEWNHYPPGDVYDPETHAQYYYHAHPAEQRFPGEHGHFHTFLRPYGMPAGIRPAATVSGHAAGDQNGNSALSHLVGIAVDDRGQPLRLFTVNRWVTGETWYRAADVAAMLAHFAVEIVRPSWVTNRWITAVVQLFAPQIEALLQARDRTVAAWHHRHPSADVLEDRRLEVTSWMDVSLPDQIAAVQAAQR